MKDVESIGQAGGAGWQRRPSSVDWLGRYLESQLPKHIAMMAIVLWSVVVGNSASQTATASSAHEIDRDIWAVFVATVAADDIVGMGRVYFPTRCWSRRRRRTDQGNAGEMGTRHGRRQSEGRQSHRGVSLLSPSRRQHDGVRSRHLQVHHHRQVWREYSSSTRSRNSW